jgi:3-oxoacyl-[acyl-carrier protein] reductase
LEAELNGKTALVTGASQNLGRAMALALAEAGANVVLNTRQNRAGVEAVAEEIREKGQAALVAMGDVGSPEDVEEIARAAEARFQRVDILVNNAAVRPRQAFLSITPEDWERVLNTNLLGPISCARRFLPAMSSAGWGRVINISGIDAYEPMTHRAHNMTCKAGVIGFTRALAKELGAAGITVNAIVPGIFETTRTREDYPMWPLPEEVAREMVPVGRFGRPEELARLCVFLASDASSYINGQAIHCNGGRVMF